VHPYNTTAEATFIINLHLPCATIIKLLVHGPGLQAAPVNNGLEFKKVGVQVAQCNKQNVKCIEITNLHASRPKSNLIV
jgi:hypothetical protein